MFHIYTPYHIHVMSDRRTLRCTYLPSLSGSLDHFIPWPLCFEEPRSPLAILDWH